MKYIFTYSVRDIIGIILLLLSIIFGLVYLVIYYYEKIIFKLKIRREGRINRRKNKD